MATLLVVLRILFLVLIAHSCLAEPTREEPAEFGGESSGDIGAPGGGRKRSAVAAAAGERRKRHDGLEWGAGRPGAAPVVESAELADERQLSAAAAREPEPALEAALERRLGQLEGGGGGGKLAAANSLRPANQLAKAAAESAADSQVNYAELCYLSNGGSSLTLTVNEATQVGSIIGTVEVNGDPSLESGNVDLFDVPEAAAPKFAANLSAGHEQLSAELPAGKQRRLLGRRSPEQSNQMRLISSSELPETNQRAPDDERPATTTTSASVAPQTQPLGLATGLEGAGDSAHFYSLLAATSGAQRQEPVRLEPGTKNLILVRALDKESAEGELGLVINVRCSPRSSKQQAGRNQDQSSRRPSWSSRSADSTTIPVRIIVTDANDQAPRFVGQQPYVVNISETTPIGAVASRDILALDRDSAGPFSTIHYRVLEDGAAHSALLQFANPLDPTLLVAGQLDYERLASFTLTILAQDQGEPEPLSASAQLQVNIIDFDDQNPRFLDDKYTLIMDETQQALVGQNLQVLPRNLYAEDGDRGICAPILYSFDQLGGRQASERSQFASTQAESSAAADSAAPTTSEELIENYLHLNPSSGEIRLLRHWPAKWASLPMTLVVRATQADNKDRYTLTTLTITRPPTSQGAAPATYRTGPSAQGNLRPSSAAEEPGFAASESTLAALRPSSNGIEFTPDRLVINVFENVSINDKIARVRARYLGRQEASESRELEPVDLVQAPNQGLQNKTARRTRVVELQLATKRPINYQILDDQSDQFGINGVGEIFIKRPLDYEQRQDYKFRVLATYTKYSDICQVQVNVLNVNDNKPKFTQPQYTFHLTESRLKSNLIGFVQAHDADLNDTVQYSLAGDHAHLFEVSPAGQLSLRSSIKLLNITSCQLVVQATDSLGPPVHSQQARVNLHVAPQLVGRSLNLDQRPSADLEAKLFNSRSLVEGGEWTPPAGSHRLSSVSLASGSGGGGGQQVKESGGQRSSVATVMSSLQHMVRSVSFFDMPMSSALLLSALLAFLVCLLFIIVISMSVHLYRRHSKLRQRHQLAASARLRHAQLASLHSPDPSARYLEGGSLASCSPASNSPQANAVGARLGASAGQQSGRREQGAQQVDSSQPALGQADTKRRTAQAGAGSRPSSALLKRAGSRRSHRRSVRSPLETLSAQIQSATSQLGGQFARSRERAFLGSSQGENSLISSLSSQSKGSYRSNTTDDSSVMHCGHYSVNASQSPQQQLAGSKSQQSARRLSEREGPRQSSIASAIKELTRDTGGEGVSTVESGDRCGGGGGGGGVLKAAEPTHQRRGSTLMDIKIAPQNELSELTSSKPGIKSYRKLPINSLVRPLKQSNRVTPVDISGQPGEAGANGKEEPPRVREARLGGQKAPKGEEEEEAPMEGLMAMIRDPERRLAQRGADTFLAASGQVGAAATDGNEDEFGGRNSAPERRRAEELQERQEESRQQCVSPAERATIRWPQGAIPQRVKKLTWDDELSISNEDCFVAPDIQLGCPISPLSSRHEYPLQTNGGAIVDTEDQYAEQHFLFSNACSPALLSADFNSFASQLAASNGPSFQQQQQQQRRRPASGLSRHPEEPASMLGQDNCFDYTIVQSSQFHIDAFGSQRLENANSVQQQQQQHPASSYLYSSNPLTFGGQQAPVAPLAPRSQDLKLMTTAVL